MPHRRLRIIRLRPIALALCEHCNAQFHSRKRVPEEAKAELIEQFDSHQCQRQDASDEVSARLFPHDIGEIMRP
jgi:NMD protein affecting ribosome stability and mRNA decay